MISNLAELLQQLRMAEAEILGKESIKHAPTIGDMYEGLTKDILERAIPAEMGLKIVSGFIEDVEGELSNQIDLMLVMGDGRSIPYTENFVWDVTKVLAVFEVKKTLYGAELKDSFLKMWRISAILKKSFDANSYKEKSVAFAHHNFAKLTGYFPDFGEIDSLDDPYPIIHHVTSLEQLIPVRVILGYGGYSDELGLRKGVSDLIENEGIGRSSVDFPTLIICKNNSVLKLNGFPYYQPFETGEWWDTVASNSENPTRILLEILWTKISSEMNIQLPMNDNLVQEQLSKFLRQKIVEQEIEGIVKKGFAIDDLNELFEKSLKANKDEAAPDGPAIVWKPIETNQNESIILWIASKAGEITIDNQSLVEMAAEQHEAPQQLLQKLVGKRLLGWMNKEKTKARPIAPTTITVFSPSGETVVSDDPQMLEMWVSSQF